MALLLYLSLLALGAFLLHRVYLALRQTSRVTGSVLASDSSARAADGDEAPGDKTAALLLPNGSTEKRPVVANSSDLELDGNGSVPPSPAPPDRKATVVAPLTETTLAALRSRHKGMTTITRRTRR